MPKDSRPNKNLKRLIVGLVLVSLIILAREIFWKPQSFSLPPVAKTFPEIEINWEILREPLPVTLPELVVNLEATPTSTSPLYGVDLVAEIPGLIRGPFRYNFDCDNDGDYELETEETLERTYRAQGLCKYAKTGVYSPRVYVTAHIGYYLGVREKVIETKKAESTATVLVAIPNVPPKISFCDITPTEGTTQSDFTFSFTVKASDPDGDPLEYKWEFGDGEFSNEPNPWHVYKKPGFHIPKAIVSDGKGGEDFCVAFSLMPLREFSFFEQMPLVGKAGREEPFAPY